MRTTVENLRKRAGINPGELARQVGCSEANLRNIRLHGQEPHADLKRRIARALGTKVNAIVWIEE